MVLTTAQYVRLGIQDIPTVVDTTCSAMAGNSFVLRTEI